MRNIDLSLLRQIVIPIADVAMKMKSRVVVPLDCNDKLATFLEPCKLTANRATVSPCRALVLCIAISPSVCSRTCD